MPYTKYLNKKMKNELIKKIVAMKLFIILCLSDNFTLYNVKYQKLNLNIHSVSPLNIVTIFIGLKTN